MADSITIEFRSHMLLTKLSLKFWYVIMRIFPWVYFNMRLMQPKTLTFKHGGVIHIWFMPLIMTRKPKRA